MQDELSGPINFEAEPLKKGGTMIPSLDFDFSDFIRTKGEGAIWEKLAKAKYDITTPETRWSRVFGGLTLVCATGV
jgi:hypothetical protein